MEVNDTSRVVGLDITDHDLIRTTVFLPNGLFHSKTAVIEELKSFDTQLANASVKRLFALWDQYYWHVLIKSWQPFAKCDECAKYKVSELMSAAIDTPEAAAMTAERDVHRIRVSIGRLRYMQRALLAKVYPQYFLHMCIDGMDNKKTNLPHCHGALFSKDIENAGTELQTKLLGALVDGLGFFTFLTFPTYMHGSGLTWTGLMIILERLKAAGRPTPPYLFLQLDNAGRDNKNQHAFAFLGYLVKTGVFKRIFLHFLPVGHTHAEIDQRFSVIAQKIKAKDILTPSSLKRHLAGLFKEGTPLRADIELEEVADIGAYFEGTYHLFGGQGTFRDSANRKRRVHAITIEDPADPAIRFKEHDEFGKWEGEWNRPSQPLRIFKNARSLETDLGKRKLMQSDLVRIEVDELEKKWKVLKPLLRSLDVAKKGEELGLTAEEEVEEEALFQLHDDKEKMKVSKQYCSYEALEQQRQDYKEARIFWPDYLAKERNAWKSDGKDVVRKKANKPFKQAPLPTKSSSTKLLEADESIALGILEVSLNTQKELGQCPTSPPHL